MAKTIDNHQLTPDAIYMVNGQVGFSRITRHTTDKEREAANQRRKHPIDKNYTTITLYNASVVARDPANPTVEERYAAECLYRSSSEDYPGNNFSAMNKSRNLPRIGVKDPLPGNPNNYKEIIPAGELAKGLSVTLIMRVFKGQGNNGVSLDRILVNEPIRYYGNSDDTVNENLAGFGITFQAIPPENRTAMEEPEAPAEEEPAAPPAPEMNNAFSAAPGGNAFSAAPAEPAAQTAANGATASATPPKAPETKEDNGASSGNPFSSFGPGARQY